MCHEPRSLDAGDTWTRRQPDLSTVRYRDHPTDRSAETGTGRDPARRSLGTVTVNVALSAAATLVASAFALSTFDRWLRRRRPHDGAWTVSLVLFAVGSGALWWAQARGWSLTSFRVFFLAGAIVNVPWLALGTVYLLAGRDIGDRLRTWLIGLSGAATGVVLIAPTKAPVDPTELPQGSEVFGVAPRVFAAVGSGAAALVIIIGAVWSIGRVLRGRVPALGAQHRHIVDGKRTAIANGFIALGTVILSASGTLAGRLGEERAFIVTLLLGVSVLFSGFLAASSSRTPALQLVSSGSSTATSASKDSGSGESVTGEAVTA